ncbi:hypothetical protein ABT095_06090 [Kitasatospora sp. NPDC002227]|uniref:hypothetical protein n=1 Tax=Kitasatospora sp. NPDC002227 TaxID=3154773 RepID=UPI003321751C
MLTGPLSRVALPVHAHQRYGNEKAGIPVLLAAGTYALDPELPVRPWDVPTVREAPPAPPWGVVVMAPGDVRGVELRPDWSYGTGCCGLDGGGGPNLACQSCGLPVATRVDDCSVWQVVELAAEAVRAVFVELPADRPRPWAEVVQETVSPSDPGAGEATWAAATGVVLAHLFAASGGAPVTVPDGPLGQYLRPYLDRYLPPGLPPRTLAPAGPGLPEPATDLALVPVHPQTGVVWQPLSPAVPVPVAAGVWGELVHPGERTRLPVTGGLPGGVERDDPLSPHAPWRLRPDGSLLRSTLARLPAFREPWLRAIHDAVPPY